MLKYPNMCFFEGFNACRHPAQKMPKKSNIMNMTNCSLLSLTDKEVIRMDFEKRLRKLEQEQQRVKSPQKSAKEANEQRGRSPVKPVHKKPQPKAKPIKEFTYKHSFQWPELTFWSVPGERNHRHVHAEPNLRHRPSSPVKQPLPPFYTVRLSENPVFLRRTTIRPPILKALSESPKRPPSPAKKMQSRSASPVRL